LRELKKLNRPGWGTVLGLTAFAFTAMGIWGLKQVALEVMDKLPFLDMAGAEQSGSAANAAGVGGRFAPGGTPLAVGDKVAGFPVTSPMGPRIDPMSGKAGSMHQGVDLGTPIGTPIFAPAGSGPWKCLSSNSGGIGIEGPVGLPGYTTRIWHLSECIGGDGPVIAKTGNTGARTTGPHYHGEFRKDGVLLNPTASMVEPFLSPVSADSSVGLGGIDLAFIKELEGYSPCAYADGAQISWGYGTKAPGMGQCLSDPTQGEAEMIAYLEAHCLPILPANLAQHPNKATAAVSLCYNAGPGVQTWDIWNQMNAGQWDNVNFTNYTRSTTGHSLYKRRSKEQGKWDS
jgi:murein DD-endopeptidase MepM/ murein hydrolase activator NlpD